MPQLVAGHELRQADSSVATAPSERHYAARCSSSRSAHDGPSALPAARDFRPDVVVLDIGLPGMSGYEVAEQLRGEAQFARTPLIAVSGYGQDEDRRRSRLAGIDLHLTKPVDPMALQEFLARAGE